MALHPEVFWAQRSSETDAGKVADSSSLSLIALVSDLAPTFLLLIIEHRVSDGQLA